MAQRLNAGPEPASSPPAFLGQTCSSKPMPRRLFCIPSAQQKLLNDASSWADELYRRPQRPPNVPIDVLNDIEEHHTRRLKQARQPTQSPTSASSPPKSSLSTGEKSGVEGEGYNDKSGNDESEEEVIGEWSPSPERDLQFKRHRELVPEQPRGSQPPVDDRPSSPKASTPQQDASPESPFASQLPGDNRCPSPRATNSQQDASSEKSFASQLPHDGLAAPKAATPRRDASLGPKFVTQQPLSRGPVSSSAISAPQRSPSPKQPSASRPPLSFQPRSANGAQNRPQKRPSFNNFPPSSSGPEEELEVVPPVPYTRAASLVKGNSALNPTPPSAQVQVPCTAGFEPDSPMAAPPPKKPKSGNRSRYKRPDVDGLLNNPIPKALPATVSGLRRPPTKTNTNCHGLDSSLSDDFVSSSIIPSTHPDKPHFTPAKAPPSKPVVEETQRPAQQSSIASDSSPRRLPGLRPHSPTMARSLPLRSEEFSPQRQRIPISSSPATGIIPHRGTKQPSHGVRATLPNTSSPGASAVETLGNRQPTPPMPQTETLGTPSDGVQRQAPFLQYAFNYPSYTGSAGDFLNACYIIRTLQRRRALASYSYDDFIRAWHQGYIPYVESFSGSTKEPMTAIEWYMESVPRLEFTSEIVTKDNLESILAFYHPEEVQIARRRVSIPPSQDPLAKAPPRARPQADVSSASSGLQQEKQLAVPPNVEKVLSLAQGRENAKEYGNLRIGRAVGAVSTLGSQRQSQSDPVDKTAGDETISVLHQEPLRHSLSERESRKRDADNDDILPAPKMARRPESEQDRSSFSGTPRSTGYKGPRKYMNNLAKRRESLQRHFAKSLGKRPRDSIVSSSTSQQHSDVDSVRNRR